MLTRFRVQNYKCLKDVELDLTPIHVLIGQNDSGKTSLLEAMYAFFRSRSFPLLPTFAVSFWQRRDLVCKDADGNTITLSGTWQNIDLSKGQSAHVSYTFDVEFFEQLQPCALRHEYLDIGTNVLQLPVTDIGKTQLLRHCEGERVAEYQSTWAILDVLADRMSNAHMYRFDARQMAQPASLSDQRRFCMDIDGFGLATLLDDINSNDPKTFLRINEKFCEYLPQYHSVRIRSEKAVTRHWENNQYRASFGDQTGKGIHLEMGKNTFIGARQSSDGAILFLGFLALANLPDPPRLLLIEEPENGIYPKRIEQVVDLLRRFSEEGSAGKCPQIVMTTHSPYVLSHFKPEEVTFLSRRKDGTVQARPLKDAPNISQRLSGFYLGELWYNLSEQELFTDAPAEIGD